MRGWPLLFVLAGCRAPATSESSSNDAESESESVSSGPSSDSSASSDSSEASSSESESESTTGPMSGGIGDPCRYDEDCDTGLVCNPLEVCVPECGDIEYIPLMHSTELVLVVDRSAQTTTRSWDHDADPATPEELLWPGMADALESWNMRYRARVRHGLGLSPSDDACVGVCPSAQACTTASALEVAIADHPYFDFLDALPAPETPLESGRGANPAGAVLETAYASLSAGTAERRGVVWITSSLPNCGAGESCAPTDCPLIESVDDSVCDAIATGLSQGHRTAVIGVAPDTAPDGAEPNDGLPEGDFPALLEACALAGGTPSPGAFAHFQADDADELLERLREASAEIGSCHFDVQPEGIDFQWWEGAWTEFLEVDAGDEWTPYLGETLDRAGCEASEDSGWIWIVPEREILLCGPACEIAKGGGDFNVSLRCPFAAE